MGFAESDFEDVKLARPVAVVDLWSLDDRIERLEVGIERVERILKILVNHYHEERVKDWELILKEMLRKEDENRDRKNGCIKT